MTDFADILMRSLRQGEDRLSGFIGKQAGDLKERAKQGLHAAWIAPTNWVGAHAGDLALATGGHYQYNQKDGVHMYTDVPWMTQGAVTLGDYQLYGPSTPPDAIQGNDRHPVRDHENMHTAQSHVLGPAYLPYAIAGMINGLIRDGDSHGPHAFSEVGPQQDPPRPWPLPSSEPLPPPSSPSWPRGLLPWSSPKK